MIARYNRGLCPPRCGACSPLALLACSPLAAEIRSLTILHTNDLHARLSPLDNRNGGFAYLASAIRRERGGCTDCILLNAGDLVQGSPVSTIFHGLPVFEIANLLGFDAATRGQPRVRLRLDAGSPVHPGSQLSHGVREPAGAGRAASDAASPTRS